MPPCLAASRGRAPAETGHGVLLCGRWTKHETGALAVGVLSQTCQGVERGQSESCPGAAWLCTEERGTTAHNVQSVVVERGGLGGRGAQSAVDGADCPRCLLEMEEAAGSRNF